MKEFYKDLVDPLDNSVKPTAITAEQIVFPERSYAVAAEGIPLLIPPGGLFDTNAMVNLTPGKVNRSADKKNLKNYIRRSLLPSLTRDGNYYKRYQALNRFQPARVLVIGAGEKVNFYRSLFPAASVIVSDIHTLYKPDVVLDAHTIPFPAGYFDMVIAGQVLEHVIRPWVVAEELQRVVKTNGIIHIEVPAVFPYHGVPYDFYRFSFSALRTLFSRAAISEVFIMEGLFSAVAITASNACIEVFTHRGLRSAALAGSRLLFFWLRYLDKLVPGHLPNAISLPKGYGITFVKDDIARTDAALIDDITSWLKRKCSS